MQAPEPPPFLDVPALIERSGERPRGGGFWYFAGGFLLLVMAASYVSATSAGAKAVVDVAYPLLAVALVGGMTYRSFAMAREARDERRHLEAAEEFVQLRNWPAAAVALQGLLAGPPRNPAVRGQALVFLAGVLARYGRFDDARRVQDHLLENYPLDAQTAYALRLGRAMAMLREDHLFDADRAIAELRRLADRPDSAGLALVEIYRDVKTGHPAEAVELFEQRLPTLREKLGHRVADAYALVARAYDLLGREGDARRSWERATLLAPAMELQRRYPEVEKVAARFAASPAPAGM